MSHAIYLGRDGWDLDPDHFDAVKGEPQPLLDGLSWRKVYIALSEDYIKPRHGHEWFGSRFMEAAHATGAEMLLVPAGGFRREAERVVRELGADDVRLVRLHREGCTFAGDSRSYIDLSDLGVVCTDVVNADLATLREDLAGVLRAWP